MLVRSTIRSDGFWHTCKTFSYMVIPILKGLRLFDGEALAMGLAWRTMHDLQAHVRSFRDAPIFLDVELVDECMDDFVARWKMMETDLHWAGGMLNPVLRGWLPLHEHASSRRILNRVFQC